LARLALAAIFALITLDETLFSAATLDIAFMKAGILVFADMLI